MKRNRMLWAGAIGALIIVQSTFWEFARMRPDFGFIVEPWSMRGTEMVHGSIYVSIGVALLAGLLAVASKISEQPAAGAAIAIGLAVAAVVITAVFVEEDLTITFNFLVKAIVWVVGSIVLYRIAKISLGGSRMEGWMAFGATLSTTLIAFLVGFIALNGVTLEVPPAAATAIVMVPVLALALSGQPSELMANRMLVMVAFAAILALGLQAGAIRSTLIGEQVAGALPAADYQDTQVTAGYFWAQLGALVVFVSSVSMWAKRRDHILNVRRARRQREEAEESAREIQAALEAAGLS